MSLEKDIRYVVEHKFLPETFYDNSILIANAIVSSKGNLLYEVFEKYYKEYNLDLNFKKEEFSVNGYTIVPDVLYLSEITMPKPKEAPECIKIYMIFNKSNNEGFYFTLEKMDNFISQLGLDDKIESKEEFVLCGWDKNKTHLNFGNIVTNPINNEEIINKIIEIYIDLFN